MFRRVMFLGLLALAGCATTKDEHIIPFTLEQRQAFFARARPPQAYGLTVYTTENGPVFAGAHRLHQGDVALLDFESSGDASAPVIEITARGDQHVNALIDTSSRENWVIPTAALRLGLTALSGPNPYETRAGHVYDEVGGYAGLVHKITLEELNAENIVFYTRAAFGPLGPPARWLNDPAPEAVLGTSFLRSFSYVQIDFRARVALFASTQSFKAPPEAMLVARVPLKDVRGVLGVEGVMDGEPMTFILDTGGDFELVMNEPPAPTVRRLSVGELVFPREVNVVASMDQGMGETSYPRIGRKLLSRYRVSFDFRNKWVYFERPAS